MAKPKKWCAHRVLKLPYTRKSRYRKKAFIKTVPQIRIQRFEVGNLSKNFEYIVKLKSKKTGQISHNSLESARQTSNRVLEESLGKTGYKLKIVTYPHHIVREHYQAAVAQADRMSSGMAHPFGKPMTLAVQLRKPMTTIMEVHVDKQGIEVAKKAMKRASTKLSFSCSIDVVKNPLQSK